MFPSMVGMLAFCTGGFGPALRWNGNCDRGLVSIPHRDIYQLALVIAHFDRLAADFWTNLCS